jgi:hypothetical protein
MTGWRKRQVAAQSEQDMPKIGCVNHDCAQCKAQPEQKRPQNCGTGYCSCIDCVMEPEPVKWSDHEPDGMHHNKPKQEPVAWMDVDEKGAISGLRYWSEPDNRHEVALYTTPPQQQWVGLSEKERNDIEDYCEMMIGKPAFDTIEAKLKEKNSAP